MSNESETGEFDHHTYIPTNNVRGELPKCNNAVKAQPKKVTVECDFCSFTSTRVDEFRKHLLVHDDIYDLPWNSSFGRRERILSKVVSIRTVEQPHSCLINQTDKWEEMCRFVDLLTEPEPC